MKRFVISTFAIATCSIFTLAALAAQSSQMKNAIGMEFVKIPAGEFMMGCSTEESKCNADEKPLHKVRITKGFEMGKYEVTQAQWKSLKSLDETLPVNESSMVGDNNPVENVTRPETMTFAAALTKRADGYKYRLPTEAEWEYAARAGTKGDTYGPIKDVAWYRDNSNDESHAVGGKKPNAWGLYDMLGNVREWTSDTYSPTYFATSPADDPQGPPANQNAPGNNTPLPVIKGGGWPNPEDIQRVSFRYHYYGFPLRVSEVGFRLIREQVAP